MCAVRDGISRKPSRNPHAHASFPHPSAAPPLLARSTPRARRAPPTPSRPAVRSTAPDRDLAPPPVRQPTPTPTRACLPPCMIPEMKRKPAAGRPRPAKTTVRARVQSRDVPASLRAPTPSCPVASPARLSRAAMLSPQHPAPAQATKLARTALSIYPAIYRASRLSSVNHHRSSCAQL